MIAGYDIHYWIWLSLCCSPGSSAGDLLLDHFGFNPKAVYEADRDEYESIGKLTDNTIERLCRKNLEEAQNIKLWCDQNNVGMLAPDNPLYPERLFRIQKKPLMLYYKGKLPAADECVLIACVGTRRMTEYGKRQAYTISYDLARAGAVVVSGLARGVDTVCHRAALDAGGKTIAVLGCGIDRIYPLENKQLMDEIAAKGVVLTEFKPMTPPDGGNFPVRNRIISGLSQGTLVIEADYKSGALITARTAESQGRDVFSLPGMVGEINSLGTNRLIKNGAKPVTGASDILEEYEYLYPHTIFTEKLPELRPIFAENPARKVATDISPRMRKQSETQVTDISSDIPAKEIRVKPEGLQGVCSLVYDIISRSSCAISADEISNSDIPVGKVMTALTLLEIKGLITALPGGRYIIK